MASLIDTIFETSISKNKNAAKKQVYEKINEIHRRVNIKLVFDSTPVNYSITKDWNQIYENCQGVIMMREHYSTDTVKCVHNKWGKMAFIAIHKHDDADQLIWIHNGKLKIDIYDESGKNIIEEKILTYDQADQPYLIPAGTNHMLISLEHDTDFVTRYDIIKHL